jgi:hypothetical protein
MVFIRPFRLDLDQIRHHSHVTVGRRLGAANTHTDYQGSRRPLWLES